MLLISFIIKSHEVEQETLIWHENQLVNIHKILYSNMGFSLCF